MIELMPHQIDAVKRMKNGCILKGGVGSGKGITALAYYCDCERPERLIVITTAKKRNSGDWEREAALFGLRPEVDSWNNVETYKDVKNAFFIFDEQKASGPGAWARAFMAIAKNNQWIMLSATPGDVWMDYIPVFIANGFYKNRTEFCRAHVVFAQYVRYPKVERYTETAKLKRLLQSILVEMPFERGAVRSVVDVFAEYDRGLFELVWKQRWNFIEDRPIRDAAELFALMRYVVNIHPSRVEQIRNLLTLHPRVVVFYNFNYELELLREIEAPLYELNGQRHDPLPDGDEWVYLVQYMAGAEAWNCITTDTIVFYSPTYSYRTWEQAHGRIDRMNTPYSVLNYYVLSSSAWNELAIFRALAEKRDFNEKAALEEGSA